MAKIIDNTDITSWNTDWGDVNGDEKTIKSGAAVQSWLKKRIKERAGACWFNQTNYTLYFFANDEDKQTYIDDQTRTDLVISSTPLNFSADMYRVAVTNINGSTIINTTTNQTKVYMKFSAKVQKKQVTETEWQDTGERVKYTVSVDKGNVGEYTKVGEGVANEGDEVDFNVRDYIMSGDNRVKVGFESEDSSSVTSSLIYQVSMSEIYIEEMQNNWYNAIVEGQDANYLLGGFKIAGALQKYLHIDILQGDSTIKQFVKFLGASTYIDTPYFYTKSEGFDLSEDELETGVYLAKAWLTNADGSIQSTPIAYNFMYVAEADKLTAQLVCVNNVADTVYNYADNILCDYAIYSKGDTQGTAYEDIYYILDTTATKMVDNLALENVEVGVTHQLPQNVQWATDAQVKASVRFDLKIGETGSMSIQTATISLDNTNTYPATSGAVFYMNASSRSNNDSDKVQVQNAATFPPTPIDMTEEDNWTNMSWIDSMDGWATDEDGRKSLHVQAGSKVTIPYQMLTGDNITMEFCYKVSNVSDYTENCITVAQNPTEEGFRGVRIKPTNITVHSSEDTTASNDDQRGVNVADETTHHLLITIEQSYGSISGKNLVTGYVDGSKAFQFAYASGTTWNTKAPIIIGSDTADVDMYIIRHYEKALGISAAEANYINSIPERTDRATAYTYFNNIKDSENNIVYQDVVNAGYNVYVVEMLNGASIPSRANGWSKTTKGYANVEMHYGAHPLWDWKLFNVETMGQGTTSMDYYRWNIRNRIDKSNSDKKVNVAYYNEPSVDVYGNKSFNIKDASLQKSVIFDGSTDGVTNHPEVKRITAKINEASSMQSHKNGATRAFNDLQKHMGIQNEAQEVDSRVTTAVYEYPVFGFEKTTVNGQDVYTFIGLFTIGPDKGDKPTFGFDQDEIKDDLITMEGPDHDRRMVLFNHPWNSKVSYMYNAPSSSGTSQNLVIQKGASAYELEFEIGDCCGLSVDTATDEAAVQTALETNLKPFYDAVYNNSTLIMPVALTTEYSTPATMLAYINSNVAIFRSKACEYDSRFTNANMEFWIEGQYLLYYYDIETQQYVGGVNLLTDLDISTSEIEGKTLTEINDLFKEKRRARFMTQLPLYANIDDLLYQILFIIVFCATDNFGKNMYPYLMRTLANGGKWRFRQDDVDTIFDIFNSGLGGKPYWLEFKDTKDGSVYFGGSASALWNLIFESYWTDYKDSEGITCRGIRTMGKDMLTAMAELGGGANLYAGCVAFFKQYFWDNAQEYFPQSAYNIDAKYKYETAWVVDGQASVAPLAQSLGNHYSAEKHWVEQRILYCLSLFGCGVFGDYNDATFGTISFRPSSLQELKLTPEITCYPNIAIGQTAQTGTRTTAGEAKTFNNFASLTGQETVYILGTNIMTKIEGLKDLILGSSYQNVIAITAKKLKELIIGDEDAEQVTNNIPGLTFANTGCMETLDARNAADLQGTLDFSNAKRIRTVKLGGTKVAGVILPNGTKIVTLELSEETNSLTLRNARQIASLVIPSPEKILTLRMEYDAVNSLSKLYELYDADDAQIQNIRCQWEGLNDGTADMITMLKNIKNSVKKDGTTEATYHGLDAEGNVEGNPVLNGTIKLTAGCYEDDLKAMSLTNIQDYGTEGLKIGNLAYFPGCKLIYNPDILYIKFADDAVKTVLMNNGVGDGQGITKTQAEAVTSIGTWFNGNTAIKTFDEFEYFIGVTAMSSGAFRNSKLSSIKFPPSLKTLEGYDDRVGIANTPLTHLDFVNVTNVYGNFNISGTIQDVIIRVPMYFSGTSFESTTKTFKKLIVKDISTLLQCNWSGWTRTTPTQAGYIDIYLIENQNTPLGTADNPFIIPTDITTIKTYALYNWKNCVSLSFAEGSTCTSIGTSAFYNVKMTSINLPSTLTSIGATAFSGCTSLATITFDGTCDEFKAITFGTTPFLNCPATEVTCSDGSVALSGGSIVTE